MARLDRVDLNRVSFVRARGFRLKAFDSNKNKQNR